MAGRAKVWVARWRQWSSLHGHGGEYPYTIKVAATVPKYGRDIEIELSIEEAENLVKGLNSWIDLVKERGGC